MTIVRRLRTAAARRPHADIAIAVVALLAILLTTRAGTATHRIHAMSVLAAVVACAALVARCRWPVPAFVVSATAAEAYLTMYDGNQGSIVLVAPLIALYTLAERSSRRRALTIGGLAVLILAGTHLLLVPSTRLGADNLALAALGALAVAAGDASRSRRAYLAEVEARARRAERDREAEAARRVTDERLRIARELHDVIGHQLALISVQSGVAAHVLDSEPELARESLGHVRAATKAALGELRDTIGLLRRPDEQAAPTAPTAGLAGLADLLDTFRQSGLTIVERVEGTVRPVGVATDLSAYRVLQESLTNVRRHVGPTTVTVRLCYEPAVLRLVVDNQPRSSDTGWPAGAPEGAPGGGDPEAAGHHPATDDRPGPRGHGLVGMRERVEALGGTLLSGPRPDGGFRVTATLPDGRADGRAGS